MEPYRVLAIGGLDPSGGAGITADARMVQARGGMPLSVPTCLTVQNRHGVRAMRSVEPDRLTAMLEAALEDGPVHAAKIGLLADAATARVVAEVLATRLPHPVPIVVDPVLAVSAGGWQGEQDLLDAYRDAWWPRTALVTPNLPELDRLAGGDPQVLLAAGCGAVLVKGGHGTGAQVEDALWWGVERTVFAHPRMDVGEVHGTGCALATAIACELGRGSPVEVACCAAIEVMGRCLAATPRGRGGEAVPLLIV